MGEVLDAITSVSPDALARLTVFAAVVTVTVGLLVLLFIPIGQLVAYTIAVAVFAVVFAEWWRTGGVE